jgi:hypothetical protein
MPAYLAGDRLSVRHPSGASRANKQQIVAAREKPRVSPEFTHRRMKKLANPATGRHSDAGMRAFSSPGL